MLINDAGFSHQVNNVGELITKKKINEMNRIHLKYVDDMSLAESVDMPSLSHVPRDLRAQPDTFRARTGHVLNMEKSQVYQQLQKTQEYATKNPCKSKDFMPEMVVEGTRLDLVEQYKLLGVIVTSNLSWSANTDYIVERCHKKMWVIRRLKKLGADHSDLLDVYFKLVRSIVEYAVPVWNSGLTGEDICKIERIQKIACNIILGDKYQSYNHALKTLGLEKLSVRRKGLCIKFTRKAMQHDKFSMWFKPTPTVNTRIKRPQFYEVVCKTARFENSPLSYLTKLLNQHFNK